MSTSNRVYVWAWPSGQSVPVPMGLIEARGDRHLFAYSDTWRSRPDGIGLFDVPVADGWIEPAHGLAMAGAIRDALPDAWGQRVVMQRLTGRRGRDADTGDITPTAYMLESGSDRFGAIDFQTSPDRYEARETPATLTDLAEAAARLDEGMALSPALDVALAHGTSVGGARPKATIADDDDYWIAKFSSSDDRRPVVKHEALALGLARAAGLRVVDYHYRKVAGRDALLVRRFDRGPNGARYHAVSGLTLSGLDEMLGRYATYPELLDRLRECSRDPAAIGHELFERIAANIALGNTDDHARNLAALWDGTHLDLAPAYDIDPCRPLGWDASQAMAYGRDGQRASNLASLVDVCAVYSLTRNDALAAVGRIREAIHAGFADAADAAHLTRAEADAVMGTRILHPAVTDGLPTTLGPSRRLPQRADR